MLKLVRAAYGETDVCCTTYELFSGTRTLTVIIHILFGSHVKALEDHTSQSHGVLLSAPFGDPLCRNCICITHDANLNYGLCMLVSVPQTKTWLGVSFTPPACASASTMGTWAVEGSHVGGAEFEARALSSLPTCGRELGWEAVRDDGAGAVTGRHGTLPPCCFAPCCGGAWVGCSAECEQEPFLAWLGRLTELLGSGAESPHRAPSPRGLEGELVPPCGCRRLTAMSTHLLSQDRGEWVGWHEGSGGGLDGRGGGSGG